MIKAIGPIRRAGVEDSAFAFGEATHNRVVGKSFSRVVNYATSQPRDHSVGHRPFGNRRHVTAAISAGRKFGLGLGQ